MMRSPSGDTSVRGLPAFVNAEKFLYIVNILKLHLKESLLKNLSDCLLSFFIRQYYTGKKAGDCNYENYRKKPKQLA